MEIEFLGAAHEVTGSCHYISIGNKKILIDCGMEQGADIYVNQEIPVNASEINYVFLTHAHIDHSGLLPLLYQKGFRGKVYSTKATKELCAIMLRDSAHIQEAEAAWKNKKARRLGKGTVEPMYSFEDVEGIMNLFVSCDYHQIIQVCNEIEIRFVDAGHLLGSASIEIWLLEDNNKRKIVFSGDIGNKNRPLIKNPEYIKESDFVVMESTYGNRNHEVVEDYAKLLADVVRRTFKRGGNVVIPAFSVGRTQELLYYFRKIKTEHMLPEFENFEVYMDSPLAVEATNVFHQSISSCFDEEALGLIEKGINPISFSGLKTAVSVEESKLINTIKKPVIIISASGMCEAGRIRHHLKYNLWRKESCIVFVGYQVPGTLGNLLLNGIKEIKLFGEPVSVAAEICNLPGISGHADERQLKEWASAFSGDVKTFFVVHGEDKVCDEFSESLQNEFGRHAIAPYSGSRYNLLTGECIFEGMKEKVQKQKPDMSTAKEIERAKSNIYERLVSTGQYLMSIIKKSQTMQNKDLAKFADQIHALCEKWDSK